MKESNQQEKVLEQYLVENQQQLSQFNQNQNKISLSDPIIVKRGPGRPRKTEAQKQKSLALKQEAKNLNICIEEAQICDKRRTRRQKQVFYKNESKKQSIKSEEQVEQSVKMEEEYSSHKDEEEEKINELDYTASKPKRISKKQTEVNSKFQQNSDESDNSSSDLFSPAQKQKCKFLQKQLKQINFLVSEGNPKKLVTFLSSIHIDPQNILHLLELDVFPLIHGGQKSKQAHIIKEKLKLALVQKYFHQKKKGPPGLMGEKDQRCNLYSRSQVRKMTIIKIEKILRAMHVGQKSKGLSLSLESLLFQKDGTVGLKYRKMASQLLHNLKDHSQQIPSAQQLLEQTILSKYVKEYKRKVENLEYE